MSPANLADDPEYQERAAIRQFDGGCDQFEANQLALIDIKERQLRQDQKQQQPAKRQQPVKLPADRQSAIEELRRTAEITSKEMTAERDSEKKDKLFAEWMAIQQKIIDLKKGAEK